MYAYFRVNEETNFQYAMLKAFIFKLLLINNTFIPQRSGILKSDQSESVDSGSLRAALTIVHAF